MKDITVPTSRQASSIPVNANPNFNTFRRLAPNITGIARKKVNSAATVLDIPIIIAPRIVLRSGMFRAVPQPPVGRNR